VKEKSDESSESGENSEENSESGEESGENGGGSGENGEESGDSGEEIESGEETGEEIESGEESGEEIESGEGGEDIEVDEVESPSAHVGFVGSGPAGLVGSGPAGPVGSGPAGFVGSDGSGPVGPIGPASITGHPGVVASLVPVISILPPTPVKIKGKGKAPDDNQEDMLQDNPSDLNPASLMVGNDESGRLKHGREHSGTGVQDPPQVCLSQYSNHCAINRR